MKVTTQFFAGAVLVAAAGSGAWAQSAGTWMARGGFGTIAPHVDSGSLSAPSLSNSKADVSAASQVIGGVSYMVTDHVSVDVPLALPFEHKLSGAGALAGVGQIGKVSALPVSALVQYRWMEPSAAWRPYVGLGLTYAYFFNETGSGALTALTNPGGSATKITIDPQLTYTAQIGSTVAINKQWFVDVFYSFTPLKTRTKLSTGQSMDITLDPSAYGLTVGYKF
ncbi:MAG: OmpW family outer membrane protein [Rhodoferax sp.]|nr:OmpW family outer membrane protein [Rhodoferax sp.]